MSVAKRNYSLERACVWIVGAKNLVRLASCTWYGGEVFSLRSK